MFLRTLTKPLFKNFAFEYSLYKNNPYYFGTIKKFVLPDLGEKIKEATIKKWHVKEGDVVEEYQPLADVATDKLFTQIPASESGKIHKRYFKEEEACQVGEVLLEIEVEEEAGATTSNVKSEGEKQTATPKQEIIAQIHAETTTSEKKLATPAVRAMIKEHKIDISNLVGTGKDGRIMKEDVLNFLNKKEQPKPATTATTSTKTTAPTQKAPKEEAPEKKPFQRATSMYGATAALSKHSVTMSDFQKGMQKSMSEALTIPTFNFKDEFDMTNMSKLRDKVRKDTGLKITFMPFIIKAVSLALSEYPIVNSWYNRDKPYEYTMIDNHNISFAIDSPKGLIVPNVKNCQDKSIMEIHEEVTRIIKDAQAGIIGPKDLMEGTFSISNIGNIGGTYMGPVILPPQVAIVALGRTQLLPRYQQTEKGLELVPRQIMVISFGCDHRVLDGATVARFSNKWKSYMENPENMLLLMK